LARAAAALNHPNICTVYEIDEYENQSFIAMECIEGESLKDKIKSGPLRVDEAVEIAVEIAEGLQRFQNIPKRVTSREPAHLTGNYNQAAISAPTKASAVLLTSHPRSHSAEN